MIYILKYDPNKIALEDVSESFVNLRKVLSEEDKIYAMLYGMDILMDVPIEEIIKIRNELNEVINARTY